MSKEELKGCGKIFHQLKSNTDLYATPIQLYFKGQRKVSSGAGLLATWVAIILMLSFTLYKGSILFQKSQFSTQMATIPNSINYTDPAIVQLNEYGFDIAFKTERQFGPEFGSIVVNRVKRVVPETEGASKYFDYETLEVEPCGEDGFNHTDKQEIKQKEVNTLYSCLKNKSDLAFGGLKKASIFQYLQILLIPCVNSSSSDIICQPQANIEEFFKSEQISLVVSNYYFDNDDLEHPVKSYIDDSIYYTVVPGQKLASDIFISLNEAKISSSLLPWQTPIMQKFPTLEKFENHITSLDFWNTHAYLMITIQEDFWTKLYKKDIYSLPDFVSEIGGMFNSIYGCGRFFVFLFLDSLIVQSLLQELYSIKNKSAAAINGRISYHKGFHENIPEKILKEIQLRKPFVLTKCWPLKQITYCYWCKRNGGNLQNNQMSKMNKLFFKGKHKLETEFDIVTLFQMMREFKILKKVLMTKDENLLLKLNQHYILGCEESEEDSDNDFNIKNGCLESYPNSFIHLSYLSKLKEELEQISQKQFGNKKLKVLTNGIFEKKQQDREKHSIAMFAKEKKRKLFKSQRIPLPKVGPTDRYVQKVEDDSARSEDPANSFLKHSPNIAPNIAPHHKKFTDMKQKKKHQSKEKISPREN